MPRTRSLAWSELKIGVIGLAALGLAMALIIAVGGEGGFFADRYPLKTRFVEVQGLKPGAVVRLNGKEVGTVTAVEFAGPVIEVTFEVRTSVRPLITTASTATIGSLSLLGEPVIDLRAAATGTPLGDWAYVRGGGAGGPFGDLTSTASESLDQAAQLIADVRAGRGTIGRLFTDEALYEEVDTLVGRAGEVAQALNAGRGTIGGLLRDPSAHESLKASLADLQAITARVRSGEGALGRLLHDDALGRSVSGTLSNLDQISDRVNRGEGTLGRMVTDTELYDRVTGMVRRVEEVVASLDAGRGTAGQLLQDAQLYENMNRAVTELRDLLADIRKDPKRYLRVSVSIF